MRNKQLLVHAFASVVMLIFVVLPVNATEASFTITTKSGIVAEFLIADNPVITYEDNLLVVKGGNLEISVDASDVSSFDFIASDSSVDEIRIDGFNLTGLSSDSQVEILTLDGICVASFNANDSHSIRFEMNELSPGIYIVRTTVTAFKIKIN